MTARPSAENDVHRPNGCCDYHRHIADGCCHCEQPAESDATEYGVRFLVPHKNAGEAVWQPGLLYVARLAAHLPSMSEVVQRQVGPWTRVTLPGEQS